MSRCLGARGRARAVTVALSLVFCSLTARASAQCSSTGQAEAVRSSLGGALLCDQKALSAGPGQACAAPVAPACSATLIDDVRALAYGPNDPAASALSPSPQTYGPQVACQNAIGLAAHGYVSSRLSGLARGLSGAALDSLGTAPLALVITKCTGTQVVADTSGLVLPSVGPQCAAAVGAPGDVVDAPLLRDCLHTLLEVWVDRVGPSPQPLRPNIVVVLTDDQRWDTVDGRHSGDGTAVMPGVRSLGASGVTFTRAYATTPLCAPSRSSILTGQYVHQTGVYGNEPPYGATAFDDSETIGTALQAAGYRTGFFGKYLNAYDTLWTAGQEPYVPPGWSDWHAFERPKFTMYDLIEDGDRVHYGNAESDYSTDVLRDKTTAFIASAAAAGQPFFAFVSVYGPHAPAEPAQRHAGLFSSLLPFRPASYNEVDISDKPSWLSKIVSLTASARASIDVFRKDQLESLQSVDEAIDDPESGIMRALRDSGVDKDTVVVFMSDHGYLWGEHRLRAKTRIYEEDIRIPLVVRYPRLVPLPRTEPRFALNIDLAPTLLELAGAAPSPSTDGESLVRLLDGSKTSWRGDFLVEGWSAPKNSRFAAVHTARWVYSELFSGEKELYDLGADPLELENLASLPEHAPIMATFADRIRQIRPTWPGDLP